MNTTRRVLPTRPYLRLLWQISADNLARKDSDKILFIHTPGEIPQNIGECTTHHRGGCCAHFLHLDTFYPRPGDFRPGHYQLSYQELVLWPRETSMEDSNRHHICCYQRYLYAPSAEKRVGNHNQPNAI